MRLVLRLGNNPGAVLREHDRVIEGRTSRHHHAQVPAPKARALTRRDAFRLYRALADDRPKKEIGEIETFLCYKVAISSRLDASRTAMRTDEIAFGISDELSGNVFVHYKTNREPIIYLPLELNFLLDYFGKLGRLRDQLEYAISGILKGP